MRALRGPNDGPDVAGVGLANFDARVLSQKAARAFHVPVAAPNCMTLPRQQSREKRAGAARAQDEDPHRAVTLPHPDGTLSAVYRGSYMETGRNGGACRRDRLAGR